ncbi:UbiE/COQ5 methyltransferase [Catenaria anguillulae PL171]|uniref:2-methoxy-6-polyprenyl-1,4-benzoquinol methylase, mitochondrial n=1 Tax=Catenaria anguillulae PL171 TaxID=765915 RepID=A0A1Y2H4M9_9FUNG|nr:UbiE/COQ5 methyltransferase [Catenaria anguillulae PL171]
MSSSSSDNETHFGFRSVPESEKQRLVAGVFSSVADSYDLMNDAMSLGIHRCWKNLYIDRLAPTQETRLLDVAGGTGDIAMRFLNYVKEHNGGQLGNAHVTVLDINPDMLRVGQERFKKMGYADDQHVTFIEGNAEVLEGIPDNSLDAYTIAFGIRNCTHIDRVIAQAHRVLKRGGRFMVLEFGKVNNPLLAAAYDSYSFRMIPHLGQILANDRESYQYLVESIRKFPTQDEFASMMKAQGFQVIGKGYEDLTFGVATIWSGWKL